MRNYRGIFALTALLFLMLAPVAQAQKHDYVWVFGDSCGLDFSTPGGPQFFVSNRTSDGSTGENCPTLADANGRLLAFAEYYVEPGFRKPWLCRLKHGDGSVVPGGEALYGQAWSQGVFLPVLARDDAYYFICLDRRPGNLQENPMYFPEGLYLNRIEFDGNQGRVVVANRLLARGDFSASMVAIPHGDGVSWWLICHEIYSNRFVKFLFANGEVSAPMYDSIGPETWGAPPDRDGLYWGGGMLSASLSGNRVACQAPYMGITQVCAFDRCSGALRLEYAWNNRGDHRDAAESDYNDYNGCFSSSGRFLYTFDADTLWQYDISNPDPYATRFQVYVTPEHLGRFFHFSRLGPDRKIYITSSVRRPPLNLMYSYLHAIHAPDSLGAACRLELHALYLEGQQSQRGLPNMPNYRLGPLVMAEAGRDTAVCPGDPVLLGAPPERDGLLYNWEPLDGLDDPASPQPLAAPNATTTYTLTVTNPNLSHGPPCNQATDEITVEVVLPRPPEAGSNAAVCAGSASRLGSPVNDPAWLYRWEPATGLDDPASPQPFAAPDTTTTYTVAVLGGAPCSDGLRDSATVEILPSPVAAELPADTVFCAPLVLNAGFGGSWPGFSEDSLLTISAPGSYAVRIVNEDGCAAEYTLRARQACSGMEAELPSAFSPNADGLNDLLIPYAREVRRFDLRIYDRWGSLIFHSEAPANAWDGRAENGTAVPQGVYGYVLEAEGYGGRSYAKRGTVTVIR